MPVSKQWSRQTLSLIIMNVRKFKTYWRTRWGRPVGGNSTPLLTLNPTFTSWTIIQFKIFSQIGRFGYSCNVRPFVSLSLCLSPSHAIFFKTSHRPSDHMISLRPLIGQPSFLSTTPTLLCRDGKFTSVQATLM